MNACKFRDEYDDLPDGAYYAIAEAQGLTDELVEMAEWEWKNTTNGEAENEQSNSSR